jgi:hypothetical protein
MPPKNGGGGGPMGAVKTDDSMGVSNVGLLAILAQEVKDYDKVKQPEDGRDVVDDAIHTFFRVYHSLDLIAAAIDPPATHCVNWDTVPGVTNCAEVRGPIICDGVPNPTFCLEDSHLVPAFYNEEVGLDHDTGEKMESGLIYVDSKTVATDENVLIDLGNRFKRELPQIAKIGDNKPQPLLQQFLAQFDGSDFDWTTNFNICLEWAENIEPQDFSDQKVHANTKRYIIEALDRLKQLWEEQQVEAGLREIRDWWANLDTDKHKPPGSEEWLKNNPKTKPLRDFNVRHETATAASKVKVGKATSILGVNTRIFERILYRFGQSDSLEVVVDNLIDHLSAPQEWKKVVLGAYIAVAWQIYNQTISVVESVNNALKEG